LSFADIAAVPVSAGALVYEHGWQSWSPTAWYPVKATSPRPPGPTRLTMGYRSEAPMPGRGFQGEGLLALADPEAGLVRIWSAFDPRQAVPSIRARLGGGRLVVSADGEVGETAVPGVSPGAALAHWAGALARRLGTPAVASLPPVWCSWYQYFGGVTALDVMENVEAARTLGLSIGVFQVDDGWEAEVGDWLDTSPRFGRPLAGLAADIRTAGARAGVWTAPLLVGARSRTAALHPDWLVGGVVAGHNWSQDLFALDITHPDAAAHLIQVFATLAGWGFDYFKVDFLYAGALPGRRRDDIAPITAYRQALGLIRAGVGPEATLLACGAPLLPSIGLVDAMRVGPDIALSGGEAPSDPSLPSYPGAVTAVRARAHQHARLWCNDPDALIARPEMGRRREWAEVVERFGGLRVSGDRLKGLDGWGLETTRRLLQPSAVRPLVP
jgi:alpha-galactosidase